MPPNNHERHSQEVFAFQAEGNRPDQKIKAVTATVINENHKLIYYYGYPKPEDNGELFELYSIQDDPEELENMYSPSNKIFKRLREILINELEQT